MGDRFGVIVGQSADYYRVRLDRSRKVRRIATDVLEDFGRFV